MLGRLFKVRKYYREFEGARLNPEDFLADTSYGLVSGVLVFVSWGFLLVGVASFLLGYALYDIVLFKVLFIFCAFFFVIVRCLLFFLKKMLRTIARNVSKRFRR